MPHHPQHPRMLQLDNLAHQRKQVPHSCSCQPCVFVILLLWVCFLSDGLRLQVPVVALCCHASVDCCQCSLIVRLAFVSVLVPVRQKGRQPGFDRSSSRQRAGGWLSPCCLHSLTQSQLSSWSTRQSMFDKLSDLVSAGGSRSHRACAPAHEV